MPGCLAGSHLSVAFQPIFELATGNLLGHEALGRVRERGSGLETGPLELIERAEREGTLLELERRFWRIAVEGAVSSPSQDGLVFLNVHPSTLVDPKYKPEHLLEVLRDNGLEPPRVVLELTEQHACLDSDRLRWNVNRLTRSGLRVALDDIGSGYATLGVLVDLRPSVFKLDQGIVRGIAGDRVRAALTRALAQFAEHAAMTLIAEGIETAEDRATLLELGVRYGQGFLLGRPTSRGQPHAADAEELLRAVG